MRYLIYDDECNFCCSVVRRLTLLIGKPVITYIPFKSAKGEQLINYYNLDNVNSVIYIDDKCKVYIKAIAVLHIFKLMKFPYNLIYVFNIFPNSILNFIYDFIARYRMKININ